MRRLGVTLWLIVAAAVAAPAAGAGLVVGFADNALLWDSTAIAGSARALGAGGMRVSVNWAPGQTALTPDDQAWLDSAFAASSGLRIVLVVVGGAATYAPQDDAARDEFCTYARNILARYPALDEVVVWNEPNKTAFWRPQFNADGTSASPAAYQALLARCYDVLRGVRPSVRVLGPALSPDGNDNPNAVSNISHSPGNFIRKLGEAYRASARAAPILDVVAHHVYGATSAERPWLRHTGQTRIAEGDWDKLMTNLHTAFDGTAQPVPGQCMQYRCVSIAYMEGGFQTSIDPGKASLYTSSENVTVIPDDAGGEPASPPPSATSPAPDQSTQIVDAVRLAACQNYVGAFFNFILRDETDLKGWQSGPLWADGTQKDSYWAFRQAYGEASTGSVDCAALKGGLPPRPDTSAPGVPSGLGATAGPSRRVSLDWADPSETDVRGYDVYRSTTAGGPYTKLTGDPVAASAFVDDGVAYSQTYYYVVAAVDTADNRGPQSAEASATVAGPPTAALVRVFTARRSGTTIVLRWRTGTEVGVLGFHVYREGRRLNGALLPAAGTTRGVAYMLRAAAKPGRYWLEVVRLDGSRLRFGPVRAAS